MKIVILGAGKMGIFSLPMYSVSTMKSPYTT